MKHGRGLGLLMVSLIALVALSSRAQAARVDNLYVAEQLVAEQSGDVSKRQALAALEQVLIKVSGRRDIMAQTALQAVIDNPQQFIQRFSYAATSLPIQMASGQEVVAQRLRVVFEEQLIDNLLQSAGLRPLGVVRPGVLLWLVEERGGRREYIGQSDDPALGVMLERATARGLPIFRPLLDLEDEQNLPVGEAWGFFREPILQASQRYRADAVLVGRVFRDRKQAWRSNWQLFWQETVHNFDGSGQSLADQLSSAVEISADRLFAGFVAPVGGERAEIELTIEALNSFSAYAQLRRYLAELPSVRTIAVRTVEQERMVLALTLDGSLKQLQDKLRLYKRLKPQLNYGSASGEPEITYRWVDAIQ